jgi:hypothetical protein
MGTKVESAPSGAASREEFQALLDRVLTLVSSDPDAGPRLAAARVAQRVEVSDLGLVLNLASSDKPGHGLRWEFSDDVDWRPHLSLAMDSDVANRYLQGKENFAIAIARKRIRVSCGDVGAALRLFPLYRPIFDRFRQVVESDYPQLAA